MIEAGDTFEKIAGQVESFIKDLRENEDFTDEMKASVFRGFLLNVSGGDELLDVIMKLEAEQ